jgi:tripartite-type tricarboxylate transporter receptor subunit TctC
MMSTCFPRRRPWGGLLTGLLAAVLHAGPAGAQADAKPPSTLRIVVPFSPGGSNDVIARAIAPLLAKRLELTVIIDNKPGAGGSIGADFVAKAPKDGGTLLLTSSSLLTAAATQPKLPFDPLSSLAPVAMIGNGPMLLAVSGTAPWRTPAELISDARVRPDTLNYGTAGMGSIAHLSTELMVEAAGMRATHVPYKGAADALLGLAGDQIHLMITNYSSVAGQLKSGKVRALAVTSASPSPAFPNLPPLAAALPGYGVEIWVGVFAPAGTPAPLIERYNAELVAIAASPELRAVLEPDGALPGKLGSAAFGARLRDDLALWKRIVTQRQIKIE